MKLQPEVAADCGLHSTKTGREEGAHLYPMFKKKKIFFLKFLVIQRWFPTLKPKIHFFTVPFLYRVDLASILNMAILGT